MLRRLSDPGIQPVFNGRLQIVLRGYDVEGKPTVHEQAWNGCQLETPEYGRFAEQVDGEAQKSIPTGG